MASHNVLGKYGENQAVDFLIKNGYRILKQNYYFNKFEIDIIAQKDQILVGVEVKTRSTANFGNPQDFVKPKQIKNLVKALNHYIETEQLDLEVRFDIIAVLKTEHSFKINHIKDAFYHF